nr:MAG TPA: hypothetical protein [Caudoviricetes sp.]
MYKPNTRYTVILHRVYGWYAACQRISNTPRLVLLHPICWGYAAD